MSQDDQIAVGATCWQCGSPADPDCIYARRLSRRSRPLADGHGFPVRRGRWSDTVQVAVPRCPRCQVRNWIVAALIIGGFLIGGMVGGLDFPSRGWTTVVGGFGTLAVMLVALRIYQRLASLRSIDEFPPIRQLRSEGWTDPD